MSDIHGNLYAEFIRTRPNVKLWSYDTPILVTLLLYTCLFRHFWQSIKKRKNTIIYSGFVPYIHIENHMTS